MKEDSISAQKQIDDLDAAIEDLQQRRNEIAMYEVRSRSRAFIYAVGITEEDIHRSTDSEAPCFGCMNRFAEWLKTKKPRRRFAEWNGVLYYTSSLIAGDYDPTPARYCDVIPKEGVVE